LPSSAEWGRCWLNQTSKNLSSRWNASLRS